MSPSPDTDHLVEQARRGDAEARQQLLKRHRERLKRMVAVRMDRRLAARVDPSDVVQETMADAARKLSQYLRERPLPFYPWLRRLAWERLIRLHRQHVRSRRRSVVREEPDALLLSDESVLQLAHRFASSCSSPSQRLIRAEVQARVQEALVALPKRDREVLVMRYLEQIPFKDIAATLDMTEGAVKVRHLRALERLRRLLATNEENPR
jgi:RNA polymerase sigma-70 factor, ECF subfamily